MDISFLKYKIKRLLLPTYISSNDFTNYLQKKGIRVGHGTYFFYPSSNTIDLQRPWLLSIGKYCKITEGVVILTHDYSRSVLRMKYGDIIAEARQTTIGDNVFIGIKSIILMGAQIGNNVIIGAGSVVSGKIPDKCVVSGVPARVICSLDEYYKKRKEKTVCEAVIYYKEFIEYNHREPTIKEMGAFFPLFLERSKAALQQYNIHTALSGDDQNDIVDKFLCSNPTFDNYESFKDYARCH